MARLIDADYITEGRVSNDPVVIAAKCAPTIDASPVEWLRKYTAVGVTPRGDRLTEGNERLIIHRILNDWRKEQEAR